MVCPFYGRRLIDEYAAQPQLKFSKNLKVPSFAFAKANLAEGSRLRETAKSLIAFFNNSSPIGVSFF